MKTATSRGIDMLHMASKVNAGLQFRLMSSSSLKAKKHNKMMLTLMSALDDTDFSFQCVDKNDEYITMEISNEAVKYIIKEFDIAEREGKI